MNNIYVDKIFDSTKQSTQLNEQTLNFFDKTRFFWVQSKFVSKTFCFQRATFYF